MQVTSKVFTNRLIKIDNNAFLCLVKTADALKTDLIMSQTMPMDTGDLQKDLDVYACTRWTITAVRWTSRARLLPLCWPRPSVLS